jgi:hypothetical protein
MTIGPALIFVLLYRPRKTFQVTEVILVSNVSSLVSSSVSSVSSVSSATASVSGEVDDLLEVRERDLPRDISPVPDAGADVKIVAR